MKIRRLFLVIFSFGFLLTSCEEESINSIPLDFGDVSTIYTDSTRIVQFINNIYTYVPNGFGRIGGSAFVSSATDESVYSPTGTMVSKWATGSWGPTYLPDNPLKNAYDGIRATFVYQNQIHPNIISEVMSEKGKDKNMGQIYFLRALFNFQIFMRFGGYPIVLKEITNSSKIEIPRATIDNSAEYITSLCDSAIASLPVTVSNADLGRATKGAAMAIKSRLLLYLASPLYNDPTKNEDSPMNGKYDTNKWIKAAESASAIINLKDESQRQVYKLNPKRNLVFSSIQDNEIIFNKLSATSYTLEYLNAPVGLQSGRGGNCPTLNLVDSYEMINGTDFDWNNAEMSKQPFINRDPRFYEDILYNTVKYINGYVVNTAENGDDLSGIYATRTGFYLRKFMNNNSRWWGTTASVNHSFILFRYAEVLLNYAEAMNEAYGPDADPLSYGLTARGAVNLIRTRAGLTGNTDLLGTVSLNNKDEMRNAIYKERKIELAFEEHRMFDLKRWNKAKEVLNNPAFGLKIIDNGNGTFNYSRIEAEKRVFEDKMYYYPFPLSEINRNGALVQNTGWN